MTVAPQHEAQDDVFIDSSLQREIKVSYESPDNDRRAVEQPGNDATDLESTQDDCDGNLAKEEEEEEMTPERIQTLLEDIKLEGGLEDQEMTEERVNAILEQVRQAERDMSLVSGLQEGEASGAAEESASQLDSPGAEEGR